MLEKTCEVPYGTAPITGRKTPLLIRLQARCGVQTCRLSAASRVMRLGLRGRVGRPIAARAARPPAMAEGKTPPDRLICVAHDALATPRLIL